MISTKKIDEIDEIDKFNPTPPATQTRMGICENLLFSFRSLLFFACLGANTHSILFHLFSLDERLTFTPEKKRFTICIRAIQELNLLIWITQTLFRFKVSFLFCHLLTFTENLFFLSSHKERERAIKSEDSTKIFFQMFFGDVDFLVEKETGNCSTPKFRGSEFGSNFFFQSTHRASLLGIVMVWKKVKEKKIKKVIWFLFFKLSTQK